MLRLAGALLIIGASTAVGFAMSNRLGTRLRHISALADFVDFVSASVELYRAPLDEIFASVKDGYLADVGFTERLTDGVYAAADVSGILSGDEERELVEAFSERLGSGTVEDTVRLCAYTASSLRKLEEKLRRDLPDKQRVYRAVSFLAGASVVIMMI